MWGGTKEQAEERAKGNANARNWQDEARKVLENMVHPAHYLLSTELLKTSEHRSTLDVDVGGAEFSGSDILQ